MSKPVLTPSRVTLGALAAVLAASAAPAAHAGSFYIQEQSIKAMGRAYSGEVSGIGADEQWWNPAAIARAPREIYGGVQGLLVSSTVNNAGSTITYPGGITLPVQGDPRGLEPVQNGAVPNLAFSTPISDRIAVGLSVTAPFNSTTSYLPNAWARYDALKTHLFTADVQGTVAVRATDWLDLGVGVDAQYTKGMLSNAYPNLSPLLPDGSTVLKGDGWNWGWTVGAQAHFDTVTLGASYRSAMKHDISGDIYLAGLLGPLAGSNFNMDASANFTTPWIATLGASWQATPQLALHAQVQRFGWSEFDAIRVNFAGQTTPIVQDYKDTTAAGVGADYAINSVWTIRGGVQYDQTPTPNDMRTPRIPDANRWMFAAGTSWKIRPGVTIDAGLGYLRLDGDQVHHDILFYQGTLAQTLVSERGTISANAKIVSLGARWQF